MDGTAKSSQASMLWAYVHSGKIDPAKVTDLLEAALTEARAQGAAEERERLAKDPTQFKIGYALACANVVNAHEQPDIAADVLAEEFWDRQSVYSIHDWTDSDRQAFKEIFSSRNGMWPYRRSNTGEG